MPASNKTKNFELPIYVASDHFNILSDQNGAMQKIDENLGSALVQAKAASRDSTAALDAANDAQDKASRCDTLVTAANNAVTNARADASRALDKATTAIDKAETAAQAARTATATAAGASDSATQANANANAAATTADSAANNAKSAMDTVQHLSQSIEEAKAAGAGAQTIRSRMKIVQAPTGTKVINGSQDHEQYLFGGSMHLEAGEVVTGVAQLSSTSNGRHEVHWGLQCVSPTGKKVTFWQPGVASAGPGGNMWAQVSGIFKADEGAGDYTFQVIYLSNKESITVYQDYCKIVLH